MTDYQGLFLVQARADFAVFELLRSQAKLPACHALHYLQMATELLGKAYAWNQGPRDNTHRALVAFLRGLSHNRQAQNAMGFEGRNEQWSHLIRKTIPMANNIERLAPQLAGDNPNPEYPWPRKAPKIAPAEHTFSIWQELEETSGGRAFIRLIKHLIDSAALYL
jgi:hypothetical protein